MRVGVVGVFTNHVGDTNGGEESPGRQEKKRFEVVIEEYEKDESGRALFFFVYIWWRR
jgi:hypothetical protein